MTKQLILPQKVMFRYPMCVGPFKHTFITADLHYWAQKENKRGYECWMKFASDPDMPSGLRGLEFTSLNSATRALKSINKKVLVVWYILENGLYERSLDKVRDLLVNSVPRASLNWIVQGKSKRVIHRTAIHDKSQQFVQRHPLMCKIIQPYRQKGDASTMIAPLVTSLAVTKTTRMPNLQSNKRVKSTKPDESIKPIKPRKPIKPIKPTVLQSIRIIGRSVCKEPIQADAPFDLQPCGQVVAGIAVLQQGTVIGWLPRRIVEKYIAPWSYQSIHLKLELRSLTPLRVNLIITTKIEIL